MQHVDIFYWYISPQEPIEAACLFVCSIYIEMQENIHGLLTECEVKIAGYGPSSFFFACLWTDTKSRSINSKKKEV